jgi:hypothetical protein
MLMLFTLEKERMTSSTIPLSAFECQYQAKQQYQEGLSLGVPPKFSVPPATAFHDVQPHDLLRAEGASNLTNITYNQEQIDFIQYHAILMRQMLSPVISAFADTPQDMGMILNFCT